MVRRATTLFAFILLGTAQAVADFGEIDLIVRESIKNHFDEYHREVKLDTLEYFGEPRLEGNVMTIRSSVWAIQGFTNKWGLHDCLTQIEIKGPGKYEDLGSDCLFDFD